MAEGLVKENRLVEKVKPKMSKWTMIIYGLGDLASQFVWTFVGTYLTVFYTDIVGLAPLAVSMIMLLARLWDGINDPIMGMIAERTRSKFGRFRPYILFGAPFLALFSVLTFTSPFGNGTAGVIWASVIYTIAGMLYTLVNIPYGALAAVMTEDANERNELNAWRSIGMNVGMIVVNSLSAVLMLRFSEGSAVADGRGYFTTAMIYALISLPMFLGVFLTSKEVIQPTNQQKVSMKETMRNIFGNKYLMILFLIMVLQMTAFMGRIAVTTYYVIYCLGAFSLIAILMTIPSIGGAACSLLIVPLVKKFGKRNVLMVSMILQGIGLLVVYFSDFANIRMIIAGHVIFGIFNMGFPITLSLVADSVDYQELKSGVRTDGTAYATYGLATKIGSAIGAAFGVMLLSYYGYQANMEQTLATKDGINAIVNLYPAILFFLGAAACLLWDLSDQDSEGIRRELDERRQIQD